ncbi:hypothetical protein [Microbacterium sp. EST19A]|uniref:hypothetical protein n=1 Tax=Microbacterium sp. EST19A TaxID=2862681 RepID=UPI001CC13B6C|nr:hypothetical protein [Microbacterium sp. EST19A]
MSKTPNAVEVSAPTRVATEPSLIHIDPDFSMPAPGERGNSYLRALRILFPKAS